MSWTRHRSPILQSRRYARTDANAELHTTAHQLTPPVGVNGTARRPSVRTMERFSLLVLGCFCVYGVTAGKFAFVQLGGDASINSR